MLEIMKCCGTTCDKRLALKQVGQLIDPLYIRETAPTITTTDVCLTQVKEPVVITDTAGHVIGLFLPLGKES